ncbi:type II toxin-antitoxin system RelE/ParE family toxin [Cupriavidus pampae]|uniref:Type II toxin-antitoxin system RelE/ParE family toxin n=1 Tax=Cupriavidus pampae TaxID=659251 RepID=A0ABM8WAQ9_9BURK|nr:type II toxin-antitoxin system RelE/ParE family toxin [Cupriavidus pampae]CAG9164339.1 hypothetical protein LMG32289_00682 [Cupriavidus pampae]
MIQKRIDDATFRRPFAQFVKKARLELQLAIKNEVMAICRDPGIGEPKTGDLAGIWVHKFRYQRQQYLIAYGPAATEGKSVAVEFLMIEFYQVGSRENFYDELKSYLKTARPSCQ